MWWPEDPGVDDWRGLDLTALEVDEAYLNVTSDTDEIFLYSLSTDCHRCPYSLTGVVHQNRVFTINTKHAMTWRLYSRSDNIISITDNRQMLCEVSSPEVGEFGIFNLIHNDTDCNIITASPPVNINHSLFLVLGILFSFAALAIVVSLRRLYKGEGDSEGDRTTKKPRVRSLDTFRGLTLVLMVFVNDGAGGYWFLEHATWHGLFMADLLFPWFLWIMGVCIPISVRSQFKRGVPRCTMFLNALQRGCTLFLLGLMLNTVAGPPELGTIRVFGVLQRFGVVYLIVSSLAIFLTHRPSHDHKQKYPARLLTDITSLAPQYIVVLAILAVHHYLTYYVPVPGCPLGYLEAGGIQDMGQFSNCTGGVSRYIDELLVGESHMYQLPTVSTVYHTAPFDPEGFLGCLTSVVQVFLGVQAGNTLLTYHECRHRVSRWLLWGVFCGALGLVLVHCADFPINKNLWTISYVLVTSSLAFFLFSLCYLLVDHFVFWNGAPFIYPGMNSIFVYVGHMVCYQMLPWHWRLHTMNTHLILTIEAVWGTALWVVAAYFLYQRNCFITV